MSLLKRSSKEQEEVKCSTLPGEIAFPDDVRNPSAWDSYWSQLFASGANLQFHRLNASPSVRYRDDMPLFTEHGLKKALFAGNGICVMPTLFDYRGFDVVALDISSVATEFCRNNPPDEVFYYQFFLNVLMLALTNKNYTFPVRKAETALKGGGFVYSYPSGSDRSVTEQERQAAKEQAERAIQELQCPAKGVQFLTEDLFLYEPGEASFDIIILMNVAEHFSAGDRQELARRLYRWLRPGGILIVESLCFSVLRILEPSADGLEKYFEEAGFLFH